MEKNTRLKLFLLSSVIIFAVINTMIYQKETQLKKSQEILLPLAPIDPRSFLQGDYMNLSYVLTNDLNKYYIEHNLKTPSGGYAIVSINNRNIASFVKAYEGETLPQNQFKIKFHANKGLSFGIENYFFEEGKAKIYIKARYAMVKISPSGEAVLTGLMDKDFNRL